MPVLPEEKIMTVNFVCNQLENIKNWSLACKNTNVFVCLETILNNNFPELKKYETYFIVNGRRIKRYQTLDENKIQNNDIINIFLIEE